MLWQEHRNNINSNNSSSSNKSEDSNRISMGRERTCFWFIICWWGLAACTAVVSHTRASWVSHIPHSGTNIGMCVLMDSDRLMVHLHACVYTYMPLPLYNSTRKIYWYHLCVSPLFILAQWHLSAWQGCSLLLKSPLIFLQFVHEGIHISSWNKLLIEIMSISVAPAYQVVPFP